MSTFADYPHRIDPAALPFTDADIAAVEHGHPFDPTAGYRIADLVAIQCTAEAPPDFADFWQETYERAMIGSSIPALDPSFTELPPLHARAHSWRVEFSSWDCLRIGAWLHEPADRPPRGMIVHGHGYGGAGIANADLAVRHGFAVLQLSQRGFTLSRHPGITHDSSVRHVIHGIADRDSYVLRGCVVEQWHAASLLLHRYPALADKLYYIGHSFGGGLGALSLAWDPRFAAGCLGVPTFGNHPVRLAHRCAGSGEAVRLHQRRCPELVETLRYYDSAVAARHIRMPVFTEVACFDPAVIPPGQWSVANAIPSPGSRISVIPCGHHDPPPSLWSAADNERAWNAYHDFLIALSDAR